jgi:hypothetical protein
MLKDEPVSIPYHRLRLDHQKAERAHDTCHLWDEISPHVVAVQSALFRSYTERAV